MSNISDGVMITTGAISGVIALISLVLSVVSLRRTDGQGTTDPDEVWALAASLNEKKDGTST